MEMKKEVSYEQEILGSSRPVFVEFYASWCPKCARMKDVVTWIEEQYEGKIKVYQIDIDRFENLALQLQISAVPTFVIYMGGKPLAAASGVVRKEMLADMVENVCREDNNTI